jgi:hypothetical protein
MGEAARDEMLDALRAAAEVAYATSIDALALSYAARGDTERVLAMLAGGANVRASLGDGRTLVALAAEDGDEELVRALVARGADVSAADVRGATPVFAAARGGHTGTVLALVEGGADVDKANSMGTTPLFIAAAHGHTACVRALAECGADARAAACWYTVGGSTPVFAAARGGHTETVRALVRELGAGVGTANNRGETPLFIAAASGHTACVRALVLEFGADANTANNEGVTPVQAAARAGDAATAWTLVRECGAELDRARRQRLAFGMALHPRLGGGSRAYCLDEHLLQLVLRPHVASGAAASEMAAARGQLTAERVLRFLEAQEDAAPTHAAANAARRAGFECPVCLEPAGLVLVPCGHPVCRACWAQIDNGDKRCPLCSEGHVLAVGSGTWPDSAPLGER